MSYTATLGVLFLVVGFGAMFLMYHLWGFPFDKATHTSAAPKWAMTLHRALGYVFAAIYIALMWRMVPRLWEYQVEFPARTTVHIIVGFSIGFLLIVKIAIMRFFRHFEEWMPFLGTAIMLGTVILLGLSLPFVFQERALAKGAPGGDVTSDESRARVAQLLPTAGLPKEAPLGELSTADSLTSGRDVLLESCLKCHDLRTILAKPRTPSGWWSTVERMGEKPALFKPMTERDLYDVTAYLIAITPDLQKASKAKRKEAVARKEASDVMAVIGAPIGAMPAPAPTTPTTQAPATTPAPPTTLASPTTTTAPTPTPSPSTPPAKPMPAVDLAKAKTAFEQACSQCHDAADTDKSPPKTSAEGLALIQRMVKDNEATISPAEVKLIAAWLDAKYVTKTVK